MTHRKQQPGNVSMFACELCTSAHPFKVEITELDTRSWETAMVTFKDHLVAVHGRPADDVNVLMVRASLVLDEASKTYRESRELYIPDGTETGTVVARYRRPHTGKKR